MKRRDFLNGTLLSGAAMLLGPKALLAQAIESHGSTGLKANYYPPTLTGMRGSHDGSFEVAHDLAWRGNKPSHFQTLDESYDLVVVGGGISGLASAYFYQQLHGADKKILILDNHDDFGGHAKRNEYHSQGVDGKAQMLLGFGGSMNLEFADGYSATSSRLLKELGIDLKELDQALDAEYSFANFSNDTGLYMNGKMVTGNWMAAMHGHGPYREMVAQLSLAADQQDKLVQFFSGEIQLLEELSLLEKSNYLSQTSYEEFLMTQVGLDKQTIEFFNPAIRFGVGVGCDCLSVMEAISAGMPGLKALGSLASTLEDLAFDPQRPYHAQYFPDGNATIARLLVRKLIPQIAPGKDMQDIVAAKFDYSKLDQEDSMVRLRLNSTAVEVVNGEKGDVAVSYVQQGKPQRVHGKHTIMACYNGLIAHICPQLSAAQKEHLLYGVKAPLIWANVALTSGAALGKSGSNLYACPNSFYSMVSTTPPTQLRDFAPSKNPQDPTMLFMAHIPSPKKQEGQTARDLFRLGRYQVYSTPFEEYEMQIKQQLNELFAEHGFDAERDIEAITINRWSHGYAYEYFELFDDFESGQEPYVLGRKKFGNVSIANSDSEGRAYMDAAIDAAWRAVKELTFIPV